VTTAFFDSKAAGGSQFWKGLHKVKHLFKWGFVFKIGNGKPCKFWEDCWIHNVPLKILHEDLYYKLVRDPFCSVADCWQEGAWNMDFRRSLITQIYNSWLGLLDLLQDCALTDN
jgi:hypothetical protein